MRPEVMPELRHSGCSLLRIYQQRIKRQHYISCLSVNRISADRSATGCPQAQVHTCIPCLYAGTGLTDEESPGERPFLRPANDGKRKPVRRDERVQERDSSDSSYGRQIFGAETSHHRGSFLLLFISFPALSAFTR